MGARRFRTGDETAIVRALNARSEVPSTVADWVWRYPPGDHCRVIALDERDGEVEAHIGGVRRRFNHLGTETGGVAFADVFTRGGGDLRAVAEVLKPDIEPEAPIVAWIGSESPARDLASPPLALGATTPVEVLERSLSTAVSSPARYRYRAELAPDWEPRLDVLWGRVRASYPDAAVRDAEFALRRFAGHPTVKYHRFLILPRLGSRPVAWVVFRIDGGRCRWVDLLWDHRRRGALRLASVLSGRLAAQAGATTEELWIVGDRRTVGELENLGFAARPDCDAGRFMMRWDGGGRPYLTLADTDAS